MHRRASGLQRRCCKKLLKEGCQFPFIAQVCQYIFVGFSDMIYGAAQVIAHSKTGGFNHQDLVARLFRSIAQLGCYPDDLLGIRCIPVDLCALAIVQLSNTPNASGKAFHLVLTKLLTPAIVHRVFGSRVCGIRLNHWVKLVKQNPVNPMFDYVPMFELGLDPSNVTTTCFSNQKTSECLGCANLSEALPLDRRYRCSSSILSCT